MATLPLFGADNGGSICLLCMSRHETVEQARECFAEHFGMMDSPATGDG